MKMKMFTCALAIGFSMTALAHDEGHGPKLADTGKFGGLVAPVVKKSEAKLGTKATLVHKAELVRSADGTVRVYLYDKEMKPLDAKGFAKGGGASLGAKVKGKWKDVDFPLTLEGSSFIGKMPKAEGKPYNIDVTVKEGTEELLSAFDNLD